MRVTASDLIRIRDRDAVREARLMARLTEQRALGWSPAKRAAIQWNTRLGVLILTKEERANYSGR